MENFNTPVKLSFNYRFIVFFFFIRQTPNKRAHYRCKSNTDFKIRLAKSTSFDKKSANINLELKVTSLYYQTHVFKNNYLTILAAH
jgi:hypothetical protein